MTVPLLSVITPLYRSAGTLARCMRSIERATQATGVGIEAILVFDGPDDQAMHVARSHEGGSSVSWILIGQVHGGIAAARNAGLRAASARLVTLLDADDEITDARCAAVAEWTHDAVVIGRQDVVSANGAGVPGLRATGGEARAHVASLIAPRHWIVDIGGFDEGYRLGDDWDLIVRLRGAGHPIVQRDSVFVRRHITDDNASHDTRTLAADYLRALRGHLARTAASGEEC